MLTREYQVLDVPGLREVFGQFNYTEAPGGAINIEREWVQENIVSCTLVRARNGRDVNTVCHRLAKEPFERVHAEIADSGLWRLIDTWDGLFVPRHRVWRRANPLSSHSWGVAEDLNADTNPFGGGVTAANRALAEIFVKYGFDWGGFWRADIRDGMHFELVDPNAYTALEAKIPQLILAIKRANETLHYVNLSTDEFTPGTFTVNTSELANLLDAVWEGPVARVPVVEAVTQLGWEIFDRGDELQDKANPRYYIFVKKSNNPGA